MPLSEDVFQQVVRTPGRTDRELADILLGPGSRQQPVNQAARALAKQGRIVRRRRPGDNLTGNYPPANGGGMRNMKTTVSEASSDSRNKKSTSDASEEELKKHLRKWLDLQGWKTTIAWGKAHGVDILAEREHERWIIEVKGCGSRSAMRVNYFISILGELLQRMQNEAWRYSIALPDLPQYRNLWSRLPGLAKTRTTISALFVKPDGSVIRVD